MSPPDDGQYLDRDHYDALVIGTGFGGSVAACRLAQAGVDVAVIERGRRSVLHRSRPNCGCRWTFPT
jgi:cholesterol oxidase